MGALATTSVDLGLGGSFRRTLLAPSTVIACWPLSEISSINAMRNIAGTDYDGVIGGTGVDLNMGFPVDLPEGALGLKLTGTGVTYVEVADSAALSLAGGAIDIKVVIATTTNDATNRCIVQKQDTNSTGNGWHVSMQNQKIEFYLKVAGVVVFNFQRGAIADGNAHLIHCCYDPTVSATARINIDGALSGATVTSVSTLPATTAATVRMGAFADDAGQFIGTLCYVTLDTAGDTSSSVALHATRAWTDVTTAVRLAVGRRIEYGIRGSGPEHRVADPSTFQFALHNVNPSTGAVGYYSIGHANCRAGFDLRIPVRVRITQGGTTYYKFRGFIHVATPTTGQHRSLEVNVTAVSWLKIAMETSLNGLETQIDQASWQNFGFICDLADKPPCSTFVVTSPVGFVFPFAFDNSEVETMTAMTEFQRLAMSEQGWVYEKGDAVSGGVLSFEPHNYRQTKSVDATFDDSSLFELDIAHDVESMVNRAHVTYQPRSDGTPASTLFSQPESFIESKDNIIVSGPFTDPNQDGERIGATDLVAIDATDYALRTAAGGGGSDMSSSLQIVDESGANEARFRLHNADDRSGYFTIRKRGTPLYNYDPGTVTYEDADSIRQYGPRPVSFTMPYQSEPENAIAAAAVTVNARQSPLSNVRAMRIAADKSSALMTQVLQREVGDLIEVSEQVATGSEYVQFYIQHVTLDIDEDGFIWCTWQLVPVNSYGGYWFLDDSLLGEDTVLGWD